MRHVALRIVAASVAAFVLSVISSGLSQAREAVPFDDGFAPGMIVVKTSERRLYFVTGNGQALRYSVGVGRRGMAWQGETHVNGMHRNPAWAPPAIVRADKPHLPAVIPGGSPSNPMGVAALTLSGGEYAIHGTNAPGSIGGFVSYGCIRMHNADISDLYSRVRVGTPVVVLR
jgi:lipoprotein-anchoring transpeptidase ErfK/SrfK